jgi:hypothetical protein
VTLVPTVVTSHVLLAADGNEFDAATCCL